MKAKKIAIIGAGIGGMAAAIRLAAQGHSVEVYDKNSSPGGKLSQFWEDGFRFDAGPSLFTMPHLVNELLALAAMPPLAYERLDVLCQYFYEDGTQLTAWADAEKFAAEAAAKTNTAAEKIKQHLAQSAFIYQHTHRIFLESSLHRWRTYVQFSTLKAALRLPFLGMGQSLHRKNVTQFPYSPHLQQLFDRFATYNGSNPYQTPATLLVIPHLEHHLGAYFPEGGMYSIVEKLYEAAQKLQVKFVFNTEVSEILVQKNSVQDIRIGTEKIAYNAVVSNSDVYFSYHKLLPHAAKPQRILSQERSSSAIIFYWGIDRSFPQLSLHNIFFSQNYRAEFEAIFTEKKLYEDPTVYVNISSKYADADAPPNCENWFVMINTTAHNKQNWAEWVATARKAVIAKLSRMLCADIASCIVCEQVMHPLLIQENTGSYAGALYGNSSNKMLAAFLRHPNFSRNLKNLYFCGGSVHPGGGIPLSLLSAKIVADNFS
ncbi:MAG: phytoene desaturase [Bacteroidetes bacterium]|nr:phytoene desaturase [Bacteroidota bacterium]